MNSAFPSRDLKPFFSLAVVCDTFENAKAGAVNNVTRAVIKLVRFMVVIIKSGSSKNFTQRSSV